jgi:hypothetical protein
MLTYGRSCAVIGVPAIYFRDPHFRESLRIALGNLCAAFPPSARTKLDKLPNIYHVLRCSSGRPASLSVHIDIKDWKLEPPYIIEINPSVRRVATAYFSADTEELH